MKVLDITERICLLVYAVLSGIVVLDAALRAFDARLDNPLVLAVRTQKDRYTPATLDTIFAEQSFLQTAAFNLAFYGLLVLLVILSFRLLRAVVAAVSRPRSTSQSPSET